MEWRVTAKDGTVKIVSWLSLGKLVQIAGWSEWGVGLDVTKRRMAEEHFKGVFYSSGQAMGFATLTGRLLDANEAFSKSLGYSREELLSRKEDLLPPEQRQRHEAAIAQVVQSGWRSELDTEYVQKDGGRMAVRVTLFLVRGADGTPLGIGSTIQNAKRVDKNTR